MLDRQFIVEGLNEMRESFDLPEHHLFPMWLIANFHHNGDLSSNILDSIYEKTYQLLDEGPPGDDGLDGFYYDEDEITTYLYQAKWPQSSETKSNKKQALEVAHALNSLLAQSVEDAPKAKSTVVADVENVIQQNGQIVLRAVTGGRWTRDYKEDIRIQVDSSVRAITRIELYGLPELQKEIQTREADLAGISCELEFFQATSDPILKIPSSGTTGIGNSFVTLLSGFSIAKLANKHAERLFARNVRYFLGDKGKKANKEMKQTLQDKEKRKSFWYGHNGITILCDDSELRGSQHNPNAVMLINPQIVNGCQTTTTIKECFSDETARKNQMDFPVMGRIIQLDGTEDERKNAAELIADRTNTQAAVNSADLRANDSVQVLFQDILRKYGKRLVLRKEARRLECIRCRW